jgi:glycosyltransferase involved in cell wall biosynthesis
MELAVCVSKSETFGHVIVEPIFAGIPVVTFNIGAANYSIRDFTNGFVVKNKSERESFKAAVEFILRNKDAATTMRRNSRLFANQWLTWESTVRNMMDLYVSM